MRDRFERYELGFWKFPQLNHRTESLSFTYYLLCHHSEEYFQVDRWSHLYRVACVRCTKSCLRKFMVNQEKAKFTRTKGISMKQDIKSVHSDGGKRILLHLKKKNDFFSVNLYFQTNELLLDMLHRFGIIYRKGSLFNLLSDPNFPEISKSQLPQTCGCVINDICTQYIRDALERSGERFHF